jgi:hypothetical protein
MRYKIVDILLLQLLFSYSIFSYFEQPIGTSRAFSLGESFTAISDDLSCVSWNPAGIDQKKERQFTVVFGRPFTGIEDVVSITYNLIGYKYSFDFISCAIAWVNQTIEESVREDTAVLCLGKRFLPFNKIPLFIGMNLKYLVLQYLLPEEYLSDPIFSKYGTRKEDFSYDLGVIVHPVNWISVGFCGKNLNSPNLSLTGTETLPIEYRAGVATKILLNHIINDIVVTGDFVSFDNKKKSDTYFGIEANFVNSVSLRLGSNSAKTSIGGGYKLQYRNFNLSLDYTYSLPQGIENTLGTHIFSMIISF